MKTKKIIQDLKNSNFSSLSEELENEVAKKIAARIVEKKKELKENIIKSRKK